jgi:nucleotide-binding universal stress UspA family protein
MTITRILVPTDFSVDADAAVRYALELARPFGARVHLLHVVDDPFAAGMWSSEIYAADVAGLLADLKRDAGARLDRSVPPDAAHVSREVRGGNPTRQILDAARDHGADLIVMGTHGRTGIAHVVMGSVAERVLRHAPCPVLSLRAAAVGAAPKVA